MPTRVVNLRRELCDVYIGRPGQGHSGPFGNPIRAGEPCAECRITHDHARETIPCFAQYFARRVVNDRAFREAVLALRDQRLGCFCAPAACHGDVIAAWLDGKVWTPPLSPQISLFGGRS